MTTKCPNCGSAITYDPASADFMCSFCGSIFLAKDIIIPEEENVDSKKNKQDETDSAPKSNDAKEINENDSDTDEYVDTPEETMDYNIYSCTSCGAELMLNDVESATFCAYCGQPSVVFDRVSKHRKPKYIIPFSVSKIQALNIIKNNMKKGEYVPNELKDFKADVIRGIYVPFWIYEIYYHDCQYFNGVVKSGNSTRTCHFFRDADYTFHNLAVDASVRFDNTSSRRLEPYDMSGLTPFDPHYLSGFYADCSDEDTTTLDMLAKNRASSIFNKKVKETIPAENITIETSVPVCKVNEKSYALLPVWFTVLRHGGMSYTLMVNGQTGKLVGAVPISEERVKSRILYLTIIFSVIAFVVYALTCSLIGGENLSYVLGLAAIGIFALFEETHKNWRSYKISKQLSSEVHLDDYVSDRQGDLK